MARSREQIRGTTLLRDCPERSVGLAFVPPISDRVDSLVALAEASGERTNRKELLASLILAAVPDGKQLGEAIRRYRQSSAGQTRLDTGDSDSLALQPRRPGPRPRGRHD